MRKLESDKQSKIIKYLESIGAYVIKVTVSNKSGRPDLIICYRGKFYALEVKRGAAEIKSANELQKWNAKKIQEAGGESFFVDSLEQVKSIFKEKGNLNNSEQNYYEINNCSIRSY